MCNLINWNDLCFQYECTIEYQPLKVGESLQRIEMVSNDLGSYVYELKLKATPARPEKALYFRAGLGQSHIQVAKFLNFAKQAKADYTCKVNFRFPSFSQ